MTKIIEESKTEADVLCVYDVGGGRYLLPVDLTSGQVGYGPDRVNGILGIWVTKTRFIPATSIDHIERIPATQTRTLTVED